MNYYKITNKEDMFHINTITMILNVIVIIVHQSHLTTSD